MALVYTNTEAFKVAPRESITIIVKPVGPNPVEVAPVNFKKIAGRQWIKVRDDTTLFEWILDVEGGFSSDSNSYSLANYFANTTSPFNVNIATISSSTTGVITITTPVGDSGGRTYRFIFSKFATVAPTIFKTGGAALAGNLTVKNIDFVPKT